MGLYAPQPFAPVVTASALVAGKALSTTSGTHIATTVQIDATAPTGTYYIHFVQGNGASAIPGDGAYSTSLSFLHAPFAVAHVNGVPDAKTFDDLPGGATFTGGLWVILSTTQFTKTGSAYMLADGAVQ